MQELAGLVDQYGVGVLIVIVLAYIAVKERGRWLGLISRWRKIAERGQHADLDFEQELRQKVLLNGRAKDDLIKWVQKLYEDSVREDRLSRNIGQQFVDVMTGSLEIIDAYSKRLDQNTEALIELRKVVAQAWFVLARTREAQGDDKETVLSE